MTPSALEKLKTLLIVHEGYRAIPYFDTAGFLTVGVGRNISSNPLPEDIREYLKVHGNITPEMVDRLLEQDIQEALIYCKAEWFNWEELSDTRQIALCDFMFNLGPGSVHEFRHANAAIEAGRWAEAAADMKQSAWYQEVGDRAKLICSMVQNG